MRTRTIRSLLAGAACALAAAPAAAQTPAYDNATRWDTQSLDNAATTGSAMAGMQVTAYFADGSSSVDTWRDLGIRNQWDEGLFGVSTGFFSLTYAADVNTGAPDYFGWTLTNGNVSTLTRLVLSGAGGRTVFDTYMDDERTPNSALGYPLALGAEWFGGPTPYADGSTVTYSNPVAVGGESPLYDIYERLDLVFGTALGLGETVYFTQDTDNSIPGSPIEGPGGPGGPGNPGSTTTPEPATVGLMGLGLVGVLGVARRRRRA